MLLTAAVRQRALDVGSLSLSAGHLPCSSARRVDSKVLSIPQRCGRTAQQQDQPAGGQHGRQGCALLRMMAGTEHAWSTCTELAAGERRWKNAAEHKVLQGMEETSVGRKFGHARPVLRERGGEGTGPL